MFNTFRNAWKIEDLRKKILFTFLILLIFCIGRAIPAPFLNIDVLNQSMKDNSNASFEILNLMTGGGFTTATVFALGVTPYINASIIVQLLQVVIPALERWNKEGEEGRKKINKLTKGVTIVLGLGLSIAYYFMLRGKGNSPLIYLFSATKTAANPMPVLSAWLSTLGIIATFMAGSMLVMWLADQIDAKGIGSGMSLIIFWGIISNFATSFSAIYRNFSIAAGTVINTQTGNPYTPEPGRYVAIPLIILIFFALFLLIIVTNAAERRIPVQYAKRVVGRKMYGGQNTHIPIKVNLTGVLPVIFASSFLALPTTIRDLVKMNTNGFWYKFLSFFESTNWGYAVIFSVLILAFNYFYVTVQYNPIQMANDLRKNSGMIPGIRPGQPTTSFIQRVISKITFIGGIFLIIVALVPILITKITQLLFPSTGGINIAIGGTSLLIVVGVAIEISNTLESYMLMRHHKGFLE